jgi:hypothetical protein
MDTGAQVVACRQPAGYAALRLHNGGHDMLLLVLPLGRARCETSGVRKRGEPHSAATRLRLRARRVAYDRSAPTDFLNNHPSFWQPNGLLARMGQAQMGCWLERVNRPHTQT